MHIQSMIIEQNIKKKIVSSSVIDPDGEYAPDRTSSGDGVGSNILSG